MKFLVGIFSSITFLLCIATFTIHKSEENYLYLSPVKQINEQYIRDLRSFEKRIVEFQQLILQFDKNDPAYEIKSSFKSMRNAYKKVESLLTYLDPQFVNDHINGAPLRRLERNTAGTVVLEPQGLQVMEELVYDDDTAEHLELIKEKTEMLYHFVNSIIPQQSSIYLTDRHIFEAARAGIVRMFALGVTGFDTPSSDLAISETLVSFQSLAEMMYNYREVSDKESIRTLISQMADRFSIGYEMLHDNQEFDSFNRMEFLKEVINPLYDIIYQLQISLGIETYYETSPQGSSHPINYNSTNIFDSDFLDPVYFAGLTEYPDSQLVGLGELLFFDPILSGNDDRSCASCHNPSKGFSDGLQKSIASNGLGTVARNSPGLINSIYAERFFYDMRAEEIAMQIEHVVTDQKEFHTSYITIFEKLQNNKSYVDLFKQVFPDFSEDPINRNTMSKALSAYLVRISGFNSPFDQYVRNESDYLSPEAIKGFNLFMGKASCGTCHFAPTFSGLVPPQFRESESEVLGVPAIPDTVNTFLDPDPGRANGRLTEVSSIFKHSFKTVTVRNVGLTAPYMHNGVYKTLEEVVDFYNRGGGLGMGFDLENQTLPESPLALTKDEKHSLIAFMESLTNSDTLIQVPEKLPRFDYDTELNDRLVGGKY